MYMKSFYEFYLQVQKEAAVGPDPAPAAGAGESLMVMQIWDQLPTDIKNGLYTLPDEQLLKMNIPQSWRSQWPTVIKMAKESPAGQQAQQAQTKTYYDSLNDEQKKNFLNPEQIKQMKQTAPPVAAPMIDALAKLAQADPNLRKQSNLAKLTDQLRQQIGGINPNLMTPAAQAPQQQAPQQQAPQQQTPQRNSFFNRAANMFGFGRK
jgi:hypothetical protein